MDSKLCMKRKAPLDNETLPLFSDDISRPSLASRLSIETRSMMKKIKIEVLDIVEEKSIMNLWSNCIAKKNINKARQLLEKGIFPNNLELRSAFKKFINDKVYIWLLKDICQKIEEHLIETFKEITYVKGCYKHDEPDDIVFVYYTSKQIHIKSKYNFHEIEQDLQDNKEAMKEMEFEYESSTKNECGKKQNEANECLRVMSPDIMEAHSNLTCTSISTVKLSKMRKPKDETCIAFYVVAKGYIPIGEEALPKKLEYNGSIFRTDVREGRFAAANAGPRDYHENLKVGCRIESQSLDGGTIGGFVEHPEHGLCAITCAHAVLTVDTFDEFYNGKIDMSGLSLIQCFQPMQPEKCGEVCDVRLFGKNRNKSGMDIAFVKIDDSRKPKATTFPDIFANDLDGNRSSFLEKLLSNSLRYNPRSVIQQSNQLQYTGQERSTVIKYGCTTKLTSAVLYSPCSIRLEVFNHAREGSKLSQYLLTDQIEIRSENGKFSSFGDSGAMVFVVDKNYDLTVLGILTGGKGARSYVTPIWNILNEIQMPIPYSLADLNSTRMIVDEIKHSADVMRSKCEDLIRTLEQ